MGYGNKFSLVVQVTTLGNSGNLSFKNCIINNKNAVCANFLAYYKTHQLKHLYHTTWLSHPNLLLEHSSTGTILFLVQKTAGLGCNGNECQAV